MASFWLYTYVGFTVLRYAKGGILSEEYSSVELGDAFMFILHNIFPYNFTFRVAFFENTFPSFWPRLNWILMYVVYLVLVVFGYFRNDILWAFASKSNFKEGFCNFLKSVISSIFELPPYCNKLDASNKHFIDKVNGDTKRSNWMTDTSTVDTCNDANTTSRQLRITNVNLKRKFTKSRTAKRSYRQPYKSQFVNKGTLIVNLTGDNTPTFVNSSNSSNTKHCKCNCEHCTYYNIQCDKQKTTKVTRDLTLKEQKLDLPNSQNNLARNISKRHPDCPCNSKNCDSGSICELKTSPDYGKTERNDQEKKNKMNSNYDKNNESSSTTNVDIMKSRLTTYAGNNRVQNANTDEDEGNKLRELGDSGINRTLIILVPIDGDLLPTGIYLGLGTGKVQHESLFVNTENVLSRLLESVHSVHDLDNTHTRTLRVLSLYRHMNSYSVRECKGENQIQQQYKVRGEIRVLLLYKHDKPVCETVRHCEDKDVNSTEQDVVNSNPKKAIRIPLVQLSSILQNNCLYIVRDFDVIRHLDFLPSFYHTSYFNHNNVMSLPPRSNVSHNHQNVLLNTIKTLLVMYMLKHGYGKERRIGTSVDHNGFIWDNRIESEEYEPPSRMIVTSVSKYLENIEPSQMDTFKEPRSTVTQSHCTTCTCSQLTSVAKVPSNLFDEATNPCVYPNVVDGDIQSHADDYLGPHDKTPTKVFESDSERFYTISDSAKSTPSKVPDENISSLISDKLREPADSQESFMSNSSLNSHPTNHERGQQLYSSYDGHTIVHISSENVEASLLHPDSEESSIELNLHEQHDNDNTSINCHNCHALKQENERLVTENERQKLYVQQLQSFQNDNVLAHTDLSINAEDSLRLQLNEIDTSQLISTGSNLFAVEEQSIQSSYDFRSTVFAPISDSINKSYDANNKKTSPPHKFNSNDYLKREQNKTTLEEIQELNAALPLITDIQNKFKKLTEYTWIKRIVSNGRFVRIKYDAMDQTHAVRFIKEATGMPSDQFECIYDAPKNL